MRPEDNPRQYWSNDCYANTVVLPATAVRAVVNSTVQTSSQPDRDARMALKRFVLAWVSLCLTASTLTAHAADYCWVQEARRHGTGVKVYLYKPKGSPPGVAVPMTITRANGSRTFINQAVYTSINPVKITTRNPHTYVILSPGDELGYAGTDSGCTVKIVHMGGELELKMEGGLPRIPGVNTHFVNFMTVAPEK